MTFMQRPNDPSVLRANWVLLNNCVNRTFPPQQLTDLTHRALKVELN